MFVRLSIASVVCGAYPVGACAQMANPNEPEKTEVYYCRDNFRIPFNVQTRDRSPQWADLLASRDGGQSWHLLQTVSARDGAFRILGADEGVYQLTVQARDDGAAVISRLAINLVVDRTPPRIDVKCRLTSDNHLTVHCQAYDPHLNPNSLRIGFRVGNMPAFQEIVPQPSAMVRHADRLETVCQCVLPSTDHLEVMGQVEDMAHNMSSAQARWNDQRSKELNALQPTQAGDDQTPGSHLPVAISIQPPVDGTGSQPTGQLTAYQLPEKQLPEKQMTSSAASVIPTGNVVRSASPQFELSYAMSDEAAPRRIEIWATRDGGRSWEYWGEDSDRRSPCHIRVDRNGVFGFCVVPIASSRDEALRPVGGTPPDLAVVVQATATRQFEVPQVAAPSVSSGQTAGSTGLHSGAFEPLDLE